MLDDRDYMREPGRHRTPSRWRTATAFLLLTNAAVFLVQLLVQASWPRFYVVDYLGLSYAGLIHGYVWQLLTYQFLHGGLLHLLFNSFGLFAFGLAVEHHLGVRRFVTLYLVSGVVGGLVHVLGGLVWPSHFGVFVDNYGTFYVPMVGASAGLFGLVAAFALMFPNQELRLLFPPVTVSAKVLLGVSIGISILGVLTANEKNIVAHGAHAGGILGGWLMLRYYARQSVRRANTAYGHDAPQPESTSDPEPEPKSKTEFLSKEVDPILEKISQQGIHSLTAAEHRILEKAREKMGQR
jgi:membrane associated rhomboid family serine protease